jgi:anaerobic selenocysteine-containing dehydrogenase
MCGLEIHVEGGRVTSINPDRIRGMARELAGTEKAVVYSPSGLCNREFGILVGWPVDVINILTGHFDTPGGAMFPTPCGLVGHRAAQGVLGHSRSDLIIGR